MSLPVHPALYQRWRERWLAALLRLSKRRSRRHLEAWLVDAITRFELRGPGIMLNVGAGGEIADILARQGVKACSVDLDSGRQPDLLADVRDLAPIADASCEAVFMLEVLEHVSEPQRAAAAVARVLRPGGILIASTPFMLPMHDQPFDFFRYTLHGLYWLFRDFEWLSLRERNGYFAAIAVLLLRPYAQLGDTGRNRAFLLSLVLVPLALALEQLDRVAPSLDATTGYFFICRKPYDLSGLSPLA